MIPIIKPSVTGAGEVTEITLVIKPLVTTEGVERVHGNLILKPMYSLTVTQRIH